MLTFYKLIIGNFLKLFKGLADSNKILLFAEREIIFSYKIILIFVWFCLVFIPRFQIIKKEKMDDRLIN